jgi:NRAMP (natural resistance-associated macrophage protein)-like metal ion transporter
MKTVKRRWRNVMAFLAIMGPGLITANVDNDAGGIATYSVAGAHFGYSFLWVLLPVTLALIVIQEMAARMGAVTRKGLADLIRENYGVRLTVWILLGLLFTNLANIMAEFAGIAASAEILGLSRYVAVPLGALGVWWLVVKGNYQRVERVFLLGCVFYVSYLISVFLARPHWGEVAFHAFHPTLEFNPVYLAMLIGVVGTTIAPWMQFYQQASVVDKGITEKEYSYERIDVIVGCFVAVIVAAAILIACGATLYPEGVRIEDAADAARALQPLAGRYCALLFAFGLLNASLFAAAVLPLSTSYYICEALGFEVGVDRDWNEAPVFLGLYTILIGLGAGAILLPNVPLVQIMLASQVINGLLLPVVLILMLLLVNQKRLMGPYTNSRPFNVIAWTTTVIMIVLSLLLGLTALFPQAIGS